MLYVEAGQGHHIAYEHIAARHISIFILHFSRKIYCLETYTHAYIHKFPGKCNINK